MSGDPETSCGILEEGSLTKARYADWIAPLTSQDERVLFSLSVVLTRAFFENKKERF